MIIKKLFSMILVLGLLLSGNAYAENITIKCVDKKRDALDKNIQQSLVIGFDYYYYKKNFWLHSWGNLMPWHYNDGGEFMYHNYVDGQWFDYSAGLITGIKVNKNLGLFVEGTYNKYWNREWHGFSLGINYRVF